MSTVRESRNSFDTIIAGLYHEGGLTTYEIAELLGRPRHANCISQALTRAGRKLHGICRNGRRTRATPHEGSPGVEKICPCCGKKYTIPMSKERRGEGKYCSLGCFFKHNRREI